MSLKIRLKAEERLVVGGAVIRNGSRPVDLFIENNVPILREKDILSERDVCSVGQKIYFLIQLMYIDRENISGYHKMYLELVNGIVLAAPSTEGLLAQIEAKVLEMDFYRALKLTGSLIEYEKELIQNASK
jgi:flagellar biosynthesis repressor protein FlbT